MTQIAKTRRTWINDLGIELADISGLPRFYVQGDNITDQGLLNGRARLHVAVDADGMAYLVEPYGDDIGYVMDQAEVWVDGIYIGHNFIADQGELGRCGIKAKKCGSATDEQVAAA